MGQNAFGHSLPVEAACGDAMTDMGPDESVLILIKHCRDMKQQETRLRLITLFLLFGCTALFIFTICADLRHHKNSGSSGQGSAVEQSPAYSKQERVCPADDSQTDFQRLRIHLRKFHNICEHELLSLTARNQKGSLPAFNKSDRQYIKWDAMFGEEYLKEKRAIVIPEKGFYFVYVRITLMCHKEEEEENFNMFNVALHRWSEAYNKIVPLMDAWDGIVCTSSRFRTVFMGQLFDLLEGDHLSVWIEEGYNLTMKSSFGAYLIENMA